MRSHIVPVLLLLFVTLSAQTRLRIVVVEGEQAVNIIQQKTAVAPVIEVRDQNNNPVPGATVTFAIKGGGGRAVLGNGARQLAVTTDAAGRATVAINPLTNGTFEIEANAAMGGQTTSATISQTNVATAADAAKAAAAGGGGHTGLLITAGAVAAGGAAGWKVYEDKMNEEEDDGCAIALGANPPIAPAAGGNFSYTLNIDCNWTAASDQPWLTLTGTTSGKSNSGGATQSVILPVPIAYSLQANTTGATRTGHIVITEKFGGGGNITITQSGS